jgi:hypothetical protein
MMKMAHWWAMTGHKLGRGAEEAWQDKSDRPVRTGRPVANWPGRLFLSRDFKWCIRVHSIDKFAQMTLNSNIHINKSFTVLTCLHL